MTTPRILLIAADEETHQGLRRRLLRRGCRVFEAASRRDADRLVLEVTPDLVVLENPLPAPHRPGAFDEAMDAIEILAGPLPRGPHRARRRTGLRAWRAPAAAHPRHL